MADQLVTPAQVKARVEVADANDDALLTELIEQITDWIQDFTGRQFVARAAQTWIVDTSSGSAIEYPRGIRTVTSLSYATTDQPDAGGVYTAVAAADILLRPLPIERRPGWPATRILIRGTTAVLSAAINGARIVGDDGFATVPPSIQGIAIDAIATAFVSRMAGDSDAVGADASPVAVWARYFAPGTVQRSTLERFRAGSSMGIA